MLTKTSDESKETILLGDMNANYLVPGDNKKLKSIFDLFGFKQIILKPTRITATSKTLIDIILTNNPLNLIATDVIPMGIGDHEMVGCVRKTNTAKFEPRKITCRNYKDYNPEGMCDDLRNVDWKWFL